MERDRPDILVIPPLAFVAALILAVALNFWWPLGVIPDFPWWPGIVVGGLAGIVAIATNISGATAFRRARTNINPYKPALAVVRGGAFRYTRNPMYLGMILAVGSYGLIASNLWGLVSAGMLWAILHVGVVLREERYLSAKFGQEYGALLKATRRWL